MVMSCSAFNCTNRSGKNDVSFHRFPKDTALKKKWIAATKRDKFEPGPQAAICSEHFKPEDYYPTYASGYKKLRENVIPSVFNFPPHLQKTIKERKKRKRSLTPPPLEPSLQGDVEQEASTSSFMDLSPQKRVLTSKLHQVSNKLMDTRKKLKNIKARNLRLKKRLIPMKAIMRELKQKNLINEDYSDYFDSMPDITKHICSRIKKKGSYSPELREFALTLNFFSPKAYSYVRKTFATTLPHPRTISKWYQTIDANPGFCSEALQAIKAKVSTTEYPILCALIVDEMAIKKFVEWDGKKFVGYANCSIDTDADDCGEEAKEAYVLLVSCINSSWKIPVGYFFISGLTGHQRATIVKNCLTWLANSGVKIVSLTCDGTRSNLAMAKLLGCDFDIGNLKTDFPHPTTGIPIYFYLDACHMLKLVRNTFGVKKIIDDDNLAVEWKYISSLNQFVSERQVVITSYNPQVFTLSFNR